MNGSLSKENSFVKSRAKLFSCKSEDVIVSEYNQDHNKQPSYVNLSCAVSGYNGINQYDSKIRQDIRSRESSRDRLPLLITRSRDSSPSPTKVDARNRMSAGYALSGCITTVSNGSHSRSKSVDRGFLRQNFLNGCLDSKPPSGTVSMVTTYQKSTENVTKTLQMNDERGRVRVRSTTVAQDRLVQDSKKSFIQQRIERLYGPGALARGFFKVKSPSKGKDPMKSATVHNNNNNIVVVECDPKLSDESPGPPVFRHLNAEFRQQLKLKMRSPSVEKQIHPVIDDQQPVFQPENNSHNQSNGIVTNGSTTIEEPGHHFLKILEAEKSRLGNLICRAESYLLETEVTSSEEISGRIHAAVGKCRLLMAQKFEQFAGLCRKNLTQSKDEQFPTTGQDLAGFWDMVNIQVEHVNTLFNEIEQLRANGWKEVQTSNQTAIIKKGKTPVAKSGRNVPRSAKAEEAAKAREEARRKMMEDRKRIMKMKKNENWALPEEIELNRDTLNTAAGEETPV